MTLDDRAPPEPDGSCGAHIWLGRTAGTRDSFFFGFSGTCAPVRVFAVDVGLADQNDSACAIYASDPKQLSAFPKGWAYGTTPDGYVTRGTCPPLQPGKRYRISVIAGCHGQRLFTVTSSGHLKMLNNGKGDELRCGPAAPSAPPLK